MQRKILSSLRVLGAIAMFISSAGCDGPCEDYCSMSIHRLVDCKILLDDPEAISSEIDSCEQVIANDPSATDAICTQTSASFGELSCDDLAQRFCGLPDPYIICPALPPPPPCPRSDGNVCTEEVCKDGETVSTPIPESPRPMSEQMPNDCHVVMCDGAGNLVSVSANDIEQSGNPCIVESCINDQFVSESLPLGTACDAANGLVCVDDVCRLPCTSFEPYVSAPVDPDPFNKQKPNRITRADLNGDGLDDLVILNQTAVGVMYNRGKAGFDGAIDYTFSSLTQSHFVADIDGDGRPDIVVGVGTQIQVLFNKGDENFEPKVVGTDSAWSLGVTDLNGDGDLDIVSFNGFALHWWFNQGNGTFAAPLSNSTSNIAAMDFADVNGDGAKDFVYTGTGGGIGLKLNNGDGTFGALQASLDGSSSGSGCIRIMDINGDGNPDLIGVPTTGNVGVWPGNGDGTFGTPIGYGNVAGLGSCNELNLIDIDADADMDIVNLHGGNKVAVYTNQNGTFVGPKTYPVGLEAESLGLLDLDGDDKPEVMATNANTLRIEVLRNLGGGTFDTTTVNFAIHPPMGAVFYSKYGLATVDGHQLESYLSAFNASPIGGVSYAVATGPRAIAAADVDGNGYRDLVMANFDSSTVNVRFRKTDGIDWKYSMSYPVGSKPRSVTLADFNGDGFVDIVTANAGSDDVTLLLNQGQGVFGAPIGFPAGLRPRFVTAADFDGDDKPDLAVITEAGDYVNILLNQGDGTFGAAIGHTVSTGLRSIATADLNGDMKLDLAVACDKDKQIYVLFNEGGGMFSSPIPHEAGLHPWAVAALDANTDGIVDLAVANHGTLFDPGDVTFLYNDGNGGFAPPIHVSAGRNPMFIALTSAVGDSRLDLAITNSGGDTIVTSLMSHCQ